MPPTPHNKTLLQTFEWHTSGPSPHASSHYVQLAGLLPILASYGITTLWLPPGCKANNPRGNGYDVYDLWDLGEFDQKGARGTKWGNREELSSALARARENGLECLWDAVLNHKAGADETENNVWAVQVDDEDRRVEVGSPQQIDAWLRFDFPGRNGRYSSMCWRKEHFNGTDWDHRTRRHSIFKLIDDPNTLRTPYVSPGSTSQSSSNCGLFFSWLKRKFQKKSVSRPIPSRRPGKGWAEDVDTEKGNYDYLMFSNIDYKHPDVKEDVSRWGEWMVEDIGVDGFRLDATRHYSTTFTSNWISRAQRACRKAHDRDVFVVGEVWSGDVRAILRWLDAVQPPHNPTENMIPGKPQIYAFDAPLLFAFSRISEIVTPLSSEPKGKNTHDPNQSSQKSPSKTTPVIILPKLQRDTLLHHRPGAAVTLVTNHDTQRGQTCFVPMAAAIKPFAYAYILLRAEGLPCVFWGDIFGTQGPEAEGPVRSAQEENRERRSNEMTKETIDKSIIMTLVACRARFAYGAQEDYFSPDGRSMGWTRAGTSREDGGWPGCAVVASLAPLSSKVVVPMTMGRPGEVFVDVLDLLSLDTASRGGIREDTKRVVINDEGKGAFEGVGMGVSVYVQEDLALNMRDYFTGATIRM